jgi:uncharacterized spore protein YtfJ
MIAARPGEGSGWGGSAFKHDDRENPVGVLLVFGGEGGNHAVEPVAFLPPP